MPLESLEFLQGSPASQPGGGGGSGGKRRTRREVLLNASPRRRPSRGISWREQEAARRKQWSGTSVMRGCTPLRLQWVRGVEEGCGGGQRWLSSPSPPFRGHFCPSQWAFCALAAFFFCQRLTLPACSFFCLLSLHPPPQPSLRENKNKTKKKTQLKLRLFIPPLLLVRCHPMWQLVGFSGVAHLAPKDQSAILKWQPHYESAALHEASARMRQPTRVGRHAAGATALITDFMALMIS